MKAALNRLAVRVSLVSVVHLVSMIGVIILVSWVTFEPSIESGIVRHAELCVINMVTLLDSPEAMKEEAESLAGVDIQFAVYAASGQLMSANVSPPIEALTQSELADISSTKTKIVRDSTPPVLARALKLPDGTPGYVLFSPPAYRPPIKQLMPGFLLALFASTIGAVFLARSFAHPLTELSNAVKQLGEGDLTTRVRLHRRDELGQLANAFDDMAERLAFLVRTQQELLANVSHELRTPLARIQVALDLAAEGDAATVQEALGDISEDLAELERLVADVLQTARLDLAQGRAGPALPVLRHEGVELAPLLERVATRFRSNHSTRTLQLELPDALPALHGDPVLLRRVLDNLLDNAQKYSDPDTTITLRVRVHGQRVELAVQDHGIGIAAEDLPHITTPFFRTDRSRARRTGGLGLGLSLARRIVEAHGGELHIESRVGVGTTVSVSLPCGTLPVETKALSAPTLDGHIPT